MEKYGDMDLFPVKVVVPLIVSVRATLAVQHICAWHTPGPGARRSRETVPDEMRIPPSEDFFEPPPGYRQILLEELQAEQRNKFMKNKGSRHSSVRRAASKKSGNAVGSSSNSKSQDHGSLLTAETAPL